jgi:hypothetical protein
MERKAISRGNLQCFAVPVKKDEQSSQSAMEHISELTSGIKSGLQQAKVLIEDSSSRDQLRNRRRKFKEELCMA